MLCLPAGEYCRAKLVVLSHLLILLSSGGEGTTKKIQLQRANTSEDSQPGPI